MTRNAIGTLAAILILASPGFAASKKEAAKPQAAEPDVLAVAKGINGFATDLTARIGEQKGNLFFSPCSIETALAMTYAGARGATAQQMAKVLHFPQFQVNAADPEPLHSAFAGLVNRLNAEKTPDGKPRGYQLTVANALWGQKDYPFLKDFVELNRAKYGAGLEAVDFKNATEEARQAINAWVEKQTRQKIKDLIQQGVLDDKVKLVLTNAIYFKGDWACKFKKELTKDAPFSASATEKVSAPMMNQTADFPYMQGDGFKGLELPYAGKELSMIIFLPDKIDGLADLQKQLTAENIDKWTGKLRQDEVIVSIPRFKMTWQVDLSKALISMGMTDAFSDSSADFSGMTGGRDLYISKVVHKAFVDVNEEGTEAAGATAVIMRPTAMRMEPPTFRADHPFLFLIRDNASGAILFMGRVMNPTK